MSIPVNILDLAEKNRAFLEKINFQPGLDDPFELCSKEAYAKTELFTPEIIDTIFDQGTSYAERPVATIHKNIGMILIRPDMYHAKADFEEYMQSRFHIVHMEDVVMDMHSYWQIYKHDLYRIETMHSRLTRAAMYIGSTCRLIVFQDSSGAVCEPTTADYVSRHLKGVQGRYQSGTLRGDIVYRHALNLQLHQLDSPEVDERVALATDLFGAYRALAAQPTGVHTKADYPLLFFTGVGVHVPNGEEISTDLPQLSSETYT